NVERLRSYLDDSSIYEEASAAMNKYVVEFRAYMSAHGYKNLEMSKVEEAAYKIICRMMTMTGLNRFLPDLSGDAQSEWNQVHENLIIRSFIACYNAGYYRQWAIMEKWVKNEQVMSLLYRHYVFYYLKKRHDTEKRNPGTTEKQQELDVAWHRRKE
ncbi:hypothetical protein AAF712_016915, partial [Marasmius tenuissimus]